MLTASWSSAAGSMRVGAAERHRVRSTDVPAGAAIGARSECAAPQEARSGAHSSTRRDRDVRRARRQPALVRGRRAGSGRPSSARRSLGAMPPPTYTPPVRQPLSARLPASAPKISTNMSSARRGDARPSSAASADRGVRVAAAASAAASQAGSALAAGVAQEVVEVADARARQHALVADVAAVALAQPAQQGDLVLGVRGREVGVAALGRARQRGARRRAPRTPRRGRCRPRSRRSCRRGRASPACSVTRSAGSSASSPSAVASRSLMSVTRATPIALGDCARRRPSTAGWCPRRGCPPRSGDAERGTLDDGPVACDPRNSSSRSSRLPWPSISRRASASR